MTRVASSAPRILVVLSSTNQLYSGTGTALFDWIRVARGAIAFTVAIDTKEPRNAAIAARFCQSLGLRFIPASANLLPGCPDHGIRDVARLCVSEPWDAIECVSWANASTNLGVLNAIGENTRLIFTPHTQPIWTLGDWEPFFMIVPVFQRMVARSDLIVVDSPDELEQLGIAATPRERTAWLPLGVDSKIFSFDGSLIEGKLLSVCDFREPRKRADLLLEAFCRATRRGPEIAMTIAGSGSDIYPIPGEISNRVRRLGYVTLDRLVEEYRRCGAFVLLSDYEAFGLPIAEALCCGAPVVINRQKELERVFGDLPGVTFVDNKDTVEVARVMLNVLAKSYDRREIAETATARFSFANTYGRKLDLVLRMLGREPVGDGIGSRHRLSLEGELRCSG